MRLLFDALQLPYARGLSNTQLENRLLAPKEATDDVEGGLIDDKVSACNASERRSDWLMGEVTSLRVIDTVHCVGDLL